MSSDIRQKADTPFRSSPHKRTVYNSGVYSMNGMVCFRVICTFKKSIAKYEKNVNFGIFRYFRHFHQNTTLSHYTDRVLKFKLQLVNV